MTTGVTAAAIRGSVGPICQPLYEGVASGCAAASARLAGFANLADYPALMPLLARCAMRNYWLDGGLPSSWVVSGKPYLMGQTLLVNAEDRMELRLLKERRRTYPGGVPVAGKNAERRQYWSDRPLQPPLPLDFTSAPAVADDGVTRLLLLWDKVLVDGREQISVRVVHPIAPGYYGAAVPIDLSYRIEPEGAIFDQLAFAGDHQAEDFFPDIAQDENDGDAFGS